MNSHHLPAYSTHFVGRSDDLDKISSRIADHACRLLTLVGPGGIGKTRLAVEAARRLAQGRLETARAFRDGVYFVSLQPLQSSDALLPAITESLGLQWLSSDEPRQQLLRYLHDKSCLLVMDNFEHLLDGATLISELLTASPETKILVTSREALNLQEEWLFHVDGLSCPQTVAEMDGYDAVQVFSQTARRIRSDFSLAEESVGVLRICALVGGMPLALELAAAWVRALSCNEIADEISGLDILQTPARNVAPRHQTMRAVLDHSWELLSDPQKQVLKALSVFRGGFSREAAQAVRGVTLATLATLVDKSWLRWIAVQKRYDCHELLRQYGEEQLNTIAEEAIHTHQRHSRYYAGVMEQRLQVFNAGNESEAFAGFDLDFANIRASWDWAVRHEDIAVMEASVRFLWLFYDLGSRFHEGEQVFAGAAQALRGHDRDTRIRLLLGKVLAYQGMLAYSLDRFEEAESLLQESRDILRAFEDPQELAECLEKLGTIALQYRRRVGDAREILEASLAISRRNSDSSGIGAALLLLACVSQAEGNLPGALQVSEEILAMTVQTGNQREVATATVHLAQFMHAASRYSDALRLARAGLASYQQLEIIWGIVWAYRVRGWAAVALGEQSEARLSVFHALTIEATYGLKRHAMYSLILVAKVLFLEGDTDRALDLMGLIEENRVQLAVSGQTSELRAQLENELPPAQFLNGIERGRTLDYESTVREVLADLDRRIRAEAARPTVVRWMAEPLTERELQVLRLLQTGLSNREIAGRLGLSAGTVKWYISEIYGKLDVNNRTQVVARARELGLLS